jgi:hypothetical protein
LAEAERLISPGCEGVALDFGAAHRRAISDATGTIARPRCRSSGPPCSRWARPRPTDRR